MNQLRSLYRSKHKELKLKVQDYENNYSKLYEKKISMIKNYIKDMNDVRHKIRMKNFVIKEESEKNKSMQLKFITCDVRRMLTNIKTTIDVDLKELTHEELLRRNNDADELSKTLSQASANISKVLSFNSDNSEVTDVISQYKEISKSTNIYLIKLKILMDSEEIQKEKNFHQSKLNIKLGRFKGYNSVTDIYTFNDEFDKLYSKSTPRRLMPDLLRNNHLDEPALSLVKHVDDISEVWDRLKKAYGDSKTMLQKKLQQLDSLDASWKTKDPEKTVEAISKVINVMRDLIKLSKKHNIEAKLYNGNASEYQDG